MNERLREIELRELRTAAELAALPPLEAKVWGAEGGELVATNMLVATVNEGGMAIGAFDGDRLVGSVYGFATHEPHVLHSHYLAVDPDYRRAGLGVRLKLAQRDWCVANGRTAMRWTFDPLQLANARLNLDVLGAEGFAYYVDYYGPMTGINGGLPSDRVMVQWRFGPHDKQREPSDRLLVAVPPVSPADISSARSVAIEARIVLRERLKPLLDEGWRAVAVRFEERSYVLAR